MKRKMLTLSPSPADCKKLSIYSQHPSPQGEGTSGNPTASGWGIKKIKAAVGLKILFIRTAKKNPDFWSVFFTGWIYDE
jgi:hypothetical protein